MTAWAVHLPTAGETCVRLRLRARSDGDPWPFALAVTELQALGAQPAERFRSLGAGRGEPVVASQEFRWRGCAMSIETIRTRDGREATLTLPSWDELAARSDLGEDHVWDLVDGLAAAVDAEGGAIEDVALLQRHPAAASYRHLPRSGLSVVLR